VRDGQRYGLSEKTVPYSDAEGKRFEDMNDDLIERMRLGCEQDVVLLREMLKRLLAEGFPQDELDIIDMTIRMFTQPQFHGDYELLQTVVADERAKKVAIAASVGCSEADLRSGKKFTNKLTELGVVVPMKINKKGKEIPSVAKTDTWMIESEKRDDDIGRLIRAKEICNSSINETRAQRLGDLCGNGNPLSVQLNYFGTETTRWSSGGDKCGYQSMPRDGLIRCCLKAPPRMKLIVSDFSQIEYRALCGLAGQQDKLDALAAGRDLYCEFSAELYSREITKADKVARNVGKVGVLQCGYGSGAPKIRGSCWTKGLLVTMEVAEKMKAVYRDSHPLVVKFWDELNRALITLARGKSGSIGPIKIEKNDLVLPGGLRMHYVLRWDTVEQKWMRKTRHGEQGTWGGKMAENVASSLSRIILSDSVLAIKRELGLRPALLVHDDVCYSVPEDMADEYLQSIEKIMTRTPTWWSDGPVIAVEAHIRDRYKELSPAEERAIEGFSLAA
jgi:hypothetical protein